jgi:hypothetical protein
MVRRPLYLDYFALIPFCVRISEDVCTDGLILGISIEALRFNSSNINQLWMQGLR